MAACLLYAKIHKNRAENLLHLMLYFSVATNYDLIGVQKRKNMVQ